jgi:hypothetical protein
VKPFENRLMALAITGCLVCLLLVGCAEPITPAPGSTTSVTRAVFAGVVGRTYWIGALTISRRQGKIDPGASTLQLANGKRFAVSSGSGLASFTIDLGLMALHATGTQQGADLYVGTLTIAHGQQGGTPGKWSASILYGTTINYAFSAPSPPSADYSGALVLQGNSGRLLLPYGEAWPAKTSPWHGRPNSLKPPAVTITVDLGHGKELVCQGHLTASDTVTSFSGTFRDPGTGARRACSGNLLSFPTS